VHEDRVSAVAEPPQFSTWAFVAACAIAGALAVPLDAVASPVSTLVAGLFGFLGLRLWRWSGLSGSLKTGANGRFERVVWPAASLGLGLLVGLLLLGVIRLAIEPNVPAAGARIAEAAALPVWRRVVIIYVAAVGEELVFRLILLSMVTGVTMRFLRRAICVPSRGVVWGSIGLSAFAFAAVHLPVSPPRQRGARPPEGNEEDERMKQTPLEMLTAYVRAFETLRADEVIPFYDLPCTFIRTDGVWVVQDEPTALVLAAHLIEHAKGQGYCRTEVSELTSRALASGLQELGGVFVRYDASDSEIGHFGFTYIVRAVSDRWKIVVAVAHDPRTEVTPLLPLARD
jgi:hypothetical protein